VSVRTRTIAKEALRVGHHWSQTRKARYRRGRRRNAASKLPASYPAYYLGLIPVVLGERSAGAVLVGWRHFVQSAGEAIQLTIEAVSDRMFRVTKYRRFRDDEFERGLLQQHLSPDKHKGRSFELRALSVPPLVNLAIWLKAEDGGPDLYIPVDSCVIELKAGEIHNPDEFFPPLVESGRRLLEPFGARKNVPEVAANLNRTPKPRSKRSRSRRAKHVRTHRTS